jgi:cytochrome c-type biogenesis protein
VSLSLAVLSTAVWLGILTSISPCPLATNIAAISFIGKELASPRRVLLTGLLYTVGRSVAYAAVAAVVVASLFAVPELSFWLSTYLNQVLGPLLVVVGVVLLDVLPVRFSSSCVSDDSGRRLARSGPWGAALLGALFALSFCPVSAALFFGSLLPLAAKTQSSVLIPTAYGAGTALPVFLFAVLIAAGAQWVNRAFQKLVRLEKWARRITATIFVAVGIYYSLTYIFEVQIL